MEKSRQAESAEISERCFAMVRKLPWGALKTGKNPGAALPARTGRTGVWVLLVMLAVTCAAPVAARAPAYGPTPPAATSTLSVVELPPAGRETYGLIRAGGPFPFDKDGVVFGNREQQLPSRSRGYYREYTVATPGAGNRGARRIVCGGRPRTPEHCYYTADHYMSFREIVE